MAGEGLTGEEQQLKERFRQETGYWHESFEILLELDPEFLAILRDITAHPRSNGPLDAKTEEFVLLALNVAPTTLYADGIRRHIANAFEEGASVDEVLEVIQMASVLGVHTFGENAPILLEEFDVSNDTFTDEELAERERVRESFREERGFWTERLEPMLTLDPGFFEQYVRYSAHPTEKGAVDRKVRELVYTAIDISTTHLYPSGARVHIKNAIDYGASLEEVVEVYQLAFSLSSHSLEQSVEVLAEEADRSTRAAGRLD
jgi:alkylhydroperoxidase/carboxymuconolactone decarboxylase family protein YurZ